MYTLPPVSDKPVEKDVSAAEEHKGLKSVACEQSTSMTPTEFKDVSELPFEP